MKSDVLKELPEKIIQDYFCQLTEIQKTIYMLIVNNCGIINKKKNSANIKLNDIKPFSSLHTLILLRKLIDHPILVANDVEPLLNKTEKILIKSIVLF